MSSPAFLSWRPVTRHEARSALSGAIARMQAIARMHDAIQLSGAAEFDLGAELITMCQSLQAMAGDSARVTIVAIAVPVSVPSQFAQCVMLAVNELILNALRHAFPNHRQGVVRVELLVSSGEICVVVADDGAGIAPGHMNARGYGMKLVKAMTPPAD